VKWWWRILLPGSAVLAVMAGFLRQPRDWTPLCYLLFVAATLLRQPVAPLVRSIPGPATLKLWVFVAVSGSMFEALKWLSGGGAGTNLGVLWHDLVVFGAGYYLGWALAWSIALYWYCFSGASVFFATGFLGIVVEQDAHVLMTALGAVSRDPVAAVSLLLYVLMIYGAIMGLPYQLLVDELRRSRQREHWLKYPVVLILMYLGSNTFFLVADTWVARPLGLAP
jgi:hypothetical protein